jgi:hypothetical protein
MKNKLNLCLALALLGMVVTAYSTTCYLNQVVLCAKSGDKIVASYAHASGSSVCCTWLSFYTDVYADEDSWRYDRYSVTRGGRVTDQSFVSYCVGTCTGGTGPYTQGNDTFGFQAHYYNPAIGANVSAYNGDPAILGTTTGVCGPALEVQAFQSFTTHYANPGTTCN